MDIKSDYKTTIEINGFSIVPQVVEPEMIAKLIHAIENIDNPRSQHYSKNYKVYGHRNILRDFKQVSELSKHTAIIQLAQSMLDYTPQVVRGILFDKIPEANWQLKWHQDRMIPVKEKLDVEGFTSWSVKEGVQHVQPPVEVLEKMISLRIHLDDADEDNGTLRVIPGSHSVGKLEGNELMRWIEEREHVVCSVKAGDVIVMRPLILHSSLRSKEPRNRRVIHLEFVGEELPEELEWSDPF